MGDYFAARSLLLADDATDTGEVIVINRSCVSIPSVSCNTRARHPTRRATICFIRLGFSRVCAISPVVSSESLDRKDEIPGKREENLGANIPPIYNRVKRIVRARGRESPVTIDNYHFVYGSPFSAPPPPTSPLPPSRFVLKTSNLRFRRVIRGNRVRAPSFAGFFFSFFFFLGLMQSLSVFSLTLLCDYFARSDRSRLL